jgi:hypothetical protein
LLPVAVTAAILGMAKFLSRCLVCFFANDLFIAGKKLEMAIFFVGRPQSYDPREHAPLATSRQKITTILL